MTGKDNPRGIYHPRRSSFKDPGTIYGAAFTGGPVPVWARADGLPVEKQPRGFVVTDHLGRCVEDLMAKGAVVTGSASQAVTFTLEGIVQNGQLHYYAHGFRYVGDSSHAKTNILLSTVELADCPIDDLFLGEPDNLAAALAELGQCYVDWHREADFTIKPGRGAAGAMFLMDERFGWGPRARIPARLNNIARDHLPGNYYRCWRPGKHETVVEVDQKHAHHNAASSINFPDSINFGCMKRRDGEAIAPVDSEPWSELIKWHGLFRVAIEVDRKLLPERTFPHFEDLPDDHTEANVWLWSSELPYVLAEPGVKPLAIIESYASYNTNPGLSNYAVWAMQELERNAHNKRRLKWLKPFLLTAYGVCATRPKERLSWSSGPSARSKKATKPEPCVIGGRLIHVHVTRRARQEKQARYVNVFLRGEIEALVRARSILKARELDGEPLLEVVGVYSDAINTAIKKREEAWKLFADSVAAGPETNYARRERDEISSSAVRATSRATRSRRATFPLPGPTPQIGTVTLAARPQDMRIDDGREIWQKVSAANFAPDLLEPIGGEFRAKQVLTDFAYADGSDTHWAANETRRTPGVPRQKSSRGGLVDADGSAIIPQDSGGNGPPASTLGSPNGHEPDHSEPRRRRPEARGRSG